MLWNTFGAIGSHGLQRTAFNPKEPRLVERPQLAKPSPAFDAWLRAYRERLAEVCQRANLRPASAANANG